MGDFNTPSSPVAKLARQSLNREIRELTDVMIEIDLIDIYRTFHPNTKEYSFFSAPHGTFPKTDHILDHKANLKIKEKILKTS